MAFAPAENPQVMAIVIIDEPQGVYYGGTVAGPVMKELLSNILPYLGIERSFNEDELKLDEVKDIEVPDLVGEKTGNAKNELLKSGAKWDIKGGGDTVEAQFPKAGEKINKDSKVILYTKQQGE